MPYWKRLLIGSLVFIIVALLIGWFVVELAIYAAAIGALIAGIYIGREYPTPLKGALHGLVVGIVGGIIGGTIGGLIPDLGLNTGGWLNSALVSVLGPLTANPWYAIPSLALVGIVFGLIGGAIGPKTRRG
jgi:hypothetical protein